MGASKNLREYVSITVNFSVLFLDTIIIFGEKPKNNFLQLIKYFIKINVVT